MKRHFEMLAAYNAWANRRLYAAAAALADADYRADCGAFFGSVHGTLNHILVGDRIWLHRFTGEGPMPKALDAILYEDLPSLRAAREAEDARIVDYIGSLSAEDLARAVSYRTMANPADIVQELSLALLHVFNHETHHRGQVHCLLTRITGEAPSLDLIAYQRETGIGFVNTPPAAPSEPQPRAAGR